MKKRLLSLLLCMGLITSLFSVNVFCMPQAADSQKTGVTKARNITVTLEKTSYTWNGKAKKPKVTVKAGSATLTRGKDYTVTYKKNINVGKASVKVKLKGKYKGTKTVYFTIHPKGTELTSLNITAGKMNVRWKKQSAKMSKSRISGYQVQLATDAQFAREKKTVRIEGYKNTSKTIGKLKSGTTYYVRIRTWKKSGGKNLYSKWSEVRTVKDQGAFALGNDEKLLDALYDTSGASTIISPMSLHLALAMLLEGARGQTKEELETFLGVKQENLDAYISNILLSVSDTEDLKTIISNAFWYRQDQAVNPDYIATLTDRYAAEISGLDFNDPAAAAAIINAWCKEKTNGLIPSIVQESDVAYMSDVLINTLYFKNAWAEPVEKGQMEEGTFNAFDGICAATYLHSGESIYYENEKAVAFEKPYQFKYSFIGILPKEEGEFSVSDLDIEGLLNNRITDYDVRVTMPKFNIESGGSITGILQSLGVITAFTAFADFTGIAPDLCVSDVIHKTKMILDENGTEAAAATAIMMKDSAMPREKKIVEVILDRPYAFVIVDNDTGNILFMGKVTKV